MSSWGILRRLMQLTMRLQSFKWMAQYILQVGAAYVRNIHK